VLRASLRWVGVNVLHVEERACVFTVRGAEDMISDQEGNNGALFLADAGFPCSVLGSGSGQATFYGWMDSRDMAREGDAEKCPGSFRWVVFYFSEQW
jgi:hypothetical protein